MKRPRLVGGILIASALIAASIGAGAAPAAQSRNLIGLSTSNGRTARDFVDLCFNQHKPEEAFDKYVSHDHYMNHSRAADVVQTFESERAKETAIIKPSMHFTIEQIVAQGDLVVLHIHATGGKTANGDELVQILRLRGGKIVDHWDLHVPLQENSAVFAALDR